MMERVWKEGVPPVLLARMYTGAVATGNSMEVPERLKVELPCCCSVAQVCPTFCDLMDCSTPGFPVLHYLLEFVQTHVHWLGDAIVPSHPLSPLLLLPPTPPSMRQSDASAFQYTGLSLLPTIRPTGDPKLHLQQAASSGCCGSNIYDLRNSDG